MPKEFPYDVFLSHNAQDKPRVRRLAERLKAAGLRVWFDEWNVLSGDIIALKVDEGLEQSRVLLLCISPHALASDWVGLEQSTSIHRDPANLGRRFVPLLLADCELPDTLRRYRYIDYRDESDAAFAEILAACHAATGEESPETEQWKAAVSAAIPAKPPRPRRRRQPAGQKTQPGSAQSRPTTWEKVTSYALMSFVCFLLGAGLLLAILWKAERLVALGLVGNFYYIVLLPLGLAVAGFLFGVLRSLAYYKGEQLHGTLELGGPIVGFALVILGGLFLHKPPPESFDVTVFVRGEKGPHDFVLRNFGTVWMTLGPDLRSERIGDKGQAEFKNIPVSFRTQEVPISVEAEGFEPAKPDAQYRLDHSSVSVVLRRRRLWLPGRVQSEGFEQANPDPQYLLDRSSVSRMLQRQFVLLSGWVQDADKHLVNGAVLSVGALNVKTDLNGRFEVAFPRDIQPRGIQAEVTAPGFEVWRGELPLNGDVTISLKRDLPRLQGAEIRGVVRLNEPAGLEMANVAISADDAQPTVSNSDGTFVLRFVQKNPGQAVKLRVQKPGFVVVHSSMLRHTLLRDSKAEPPVLILMAKEGDREEMARRFFRLKGDEAALNSYNQQLKELKERHLGDTKKVALLQRELELAKTAVGKVAEEFASEEEFKNSPFYRQAIQLFLAGKLDSALEALDVATLQEEIGSALFMAMKVSRKSLEVSREFRLKGHLLALTFRFAEAAKAYQSAVEAAPEDFETQFAFAYFSQSLKRQKEALSAYTRALDLARKSNDLPRVARTLNNLGVLHSEENRNAEARQAYEEALKDYRQLAEKNPDTYLSYVARTLNNLGVLHSEENRNAEARQAYEEALKIYQQFAKVAPDRFGRDVERVQRLLKNLK